MKDDGWEETVTGNVVREHFERKICARAMERVPTFEHSITPSNRMLRMVC